ncbi:hypothetical protein TCAL_13802 [Tigriopus californicus]|uniref:CCHC-type domain-containing protein n=1 Tax=Tigriopus californicus TaxID=6832 RepID=A0A553PCR7_TIGCA|nr:hypothetical protein TCAL_13802 [Tigriopus californicus]
MKKKFGHIMKFQKWWDTFNSALHRRQDLDAAQKFSYLLSYFSGKAANSISGFSQDERNYNAAHLMATKNVEVRSLINYIQGKKTVFKVAGLHFNEPTSQLFLLTLVESKLQYQLRQKWEFAVAEEDFKHPSDPQGPLTLKKSLDDLLLYMETYASSVENTDQGREDRYEVPAPKVVPKQHPKQVTRTASSLPASGLPRGKGKKSCVFCTKSGHQAEDCPDVLKMSLKDRWKQVVSVERYQPPRRQVFNVPSVLAQATHPSDRELDCSIVRVLLDTASITGYFAKRMLNRLCLDGHDSQMSVMGINRKSTTVSGHFVSFILSSVVSSFSVEIQAFTLDHICVTLEGVTFNPNSLPSFKDLPFADTFPRKKATVDILIEAESVWPILGNETIQSETGRFDQSTSFGWALTGAQRNTSVCCRQLLQDPSRVKAYCDEIQALIDQGFVREVTDETELRSKDRFYMPHRYIVILQYIPEQDRAAMAPHVFKSKELTLEETVNSKDLGIQWIPIRDVFCLVGLSRVCLDDKPETKRTLCSKMSHVFDPVGYLGPAIIKAKILLQLCWLSGIGWDDLLPEDILDPWKIWLEELVTAALLAVASCKAIKMSISSVYFYSDSKMVIQWGRQEPHNWPTFVANCMSEIQSHRSFPMDTSCRHLQYICRCSVQGFDGSHDSFHVSLTVEGPDPFLKADKDLQRLWNNLDQERIGKRLLKIPSPIEWNYSTPQAPWTGGIWERMVQLVKESLRSCLKSAFVTQVKLYTLFVRNRGSD